MKHINRSLWLNSSFCLFALFVSPVCVRAQSETSPADGDTGGYTDSGYGNYPRVTEMEQQLLGKTYVNEPLAKRVQRLEMKQFGKVTPGDDYADQLDKLSQFIKPKTPAGYVSQDATVSDAPASTSAPTDTTDDGSGSKGQYSASDYGNYPRVTELESQFLGKTYTSDALPVRIARLETMRFKKTYDNEAMVDRLDRLDKGAKHTNALAEDTAFSGSDDSGNGKSKSGGGFGGMLGKALLSLAGGGGGIGGNGNGNTSGLLGGMGLGGGQAGIPPLLSVQRRGANQQQNNSPPPAPKVEQNPFSPGAEAIKDPEMRTAAMEKFVFGKEHPEKSMEQRVALIEKRLVPYEHNNASKPIDKRVDHLWSILSAANNQPRNVQTASQDSSVPQ